MPVFFGANYQKFSEAVELISEKGAFSVNSSNELEKYFNELLENDIYCQSTSAISKKFVENRVGATNKIMEVL